jgi:hypothetical protein
VGKSWREKELQIKDLPPFGSDPTADIEFCSDQADAQVDKMDGPDLMDCFMADLEEFRFSVVP